MRRRRRAFSRLCSWGWSCGWGGGCRERHGTAGRQDRALLPVTGIGREMGTGEQERAIARVEDGRRLRIVTGVRPLYPRALAIRHLAPADNNGRGGGPAL